MTRSEVLISGCVQLMSAQIVNLKEENFALKKENLELKAKHKTALESNEYLRKLKVSVESQLQELQKNYRKQEDTLTKLHSKLKLAKESNEDCWDKIDKLKQENRQLECQFETDMTNLMEKLQKERMDTEHHKELFEGVANELKVLTKRLVDEQDENKNLRIHLTSEKNRVASFMVTKDYREFKSIKEFSMEYPPLANSKQRGQLIICGGKCRDCVSGRHFFIKLLSN